MKKTVYTVGYEGQEISDFVRFLDEEKIQLVVDVRKNPISRKKGFSKNVLAKNLSEKNISYLHFKSLGVPTEWRKQAKNEEITRQKMFQDYDKLILSKEVAVLKQILELCKTSRLALLCYEADASDCHRRNVSDKLKKLTKGLKIEDLSAPVFEFRRRRA